MKKYLVLIIVFFLGSGLGLFIGKIDYGIQLGYTGIAAENAIKTRDDLSKFIITRNENKTDVETLNELFSNKHLRSWPLLIDEKWTHTDIGWVRLKNEKITDFCFQGISPEDECTNSKILGKY